MEIKKKTKKHISKEEIVGKTAVSFVLQLK